MEFIYNKLPLQQNLYIAVGAQVMLIKNISPENGLVNGSRGIVRQMIERDGIVYGATVEFMSGIVAVTVANWDIKMGSSVIKIKQLPLILATASTVHKVQGATLDYMQTNAANCFDYGMVYTLLSRVKNLNCLILDDFDPTKIMVHPAVKKFYNW
jgi:ATP-dependent DNA helicase PIF1